MPLISRLGAMTSKAWGQFKAAVQQVVDGYLYIWGSNGSGQFGNNQISAANVNSPVQVSSDISASTTPVIAIATAYYSLQIRGDGSLWTWGYNAWGGLGDGTTLNKSLPVQVGTLKNWLTISGGTGVNAVKSDGTLWSWGLNDGGQLGDGTTINRSSPVQIGTLTNWLKVSSGNSQCLAIKTDGTLWAWGNNPDGKLGDGTTIAISSPVQIGTLTNWSQAFPNDNSESVAIKTDGTLWMWGDNSAGQLGTNNLVSRSSPVQIGTLSNWKQVSPGPSRTFAIKTDGTLWAWGVNNSGTLGLDDTINRSSPVQIGTLTNWKSLGTRSPGSAIAIKTDGTLWAWGFNFNGRLGDGTTINRSSPVQIGSSRNWESATSGDGGTSAYVDKSQILYMTGPNDNGVFGNNTTVARSSPIIIGQQGYWGNPDKTGYGVSITKVDNSLWAWGFNDFGTIGDGTTINRSSPVQIGTLTNWKSTSQGTTNSTLAIKTDGTLWAWGENGVGQVGDGTTINRSSPVQIGGNNNWRQISAAWLSSYAINYSNQLFAWGRNAFGQLGDGTEITRSSPVQIGALTDWQSISAGSYFCLALRNPTANTGSRLWTWGQNSDGQLGVGTTINRSSPVQIGALSTWVNVSAGSATSYGIRNDGSLWAWGNNQDGMIGDNTTINRSSPVQIGTLTNWSYVNSTNNSVSAIKTDGTLWSWGQNTYGELGDGSYINKSSPVQIGTLTTWSSIFKGDGFNSSGAINNNNQLYAWGDNTYGNLGQNSVTLGQRSSPVQLGTNKWKEYSAPSSGTSVAIKDDGSLWSWGAASFGVLGTNSDVDLSSPVQVGTLTNWSKLAATGSTILSLKTDGSLWAWGRGAEGQTGLNNLLAKSSPTQIGTLTDWSKISVFSHAAAIKTNNTLWLWGEGTNGRLGNNDTVNRSSPVQLGSDTDWAEVSAGNSHTLAVKTTGSLWSWGANGSGALGSGTTVARSSPVQVGTLTNWAYVFASVGTSLAIKTDGSLWAWGSNGGGELGDGTTLRRSSPVQIGTLTNWSQVITSRDTTAAIKTDGTLWTWGYNEYGQLGDSTVIIRRSSPVQVGSGADWIKLNANTLTIGATKAT